MSEFTEEQRALLARPVITILPAFNDEWVIEVYSQDGDLEGRFNAETAEIAVESIRTALIDDADSPSFDTN